MSRVQKVFITEGARHDLEAQHYESGVEVGGAVFGFCDGGELVVDAFGGRTVFASLEETRGALRLLDVFEQPRLAVAETRP